MSEQHTRGKWEEGKSSDSIISKDPVAISRARSMYPQIEQDYGGAMICESVSPRDRPIIMGAPEMLAALRGWQESENGDCDDCDWKACDRHVAMYKDCRDKRNKVLKALKS